MYSIHKVSSFKKSYKKLKNSGIKQAVWDDLGFVIDTLASGDNLPEIYQDHGLRGEYLGYRECHIKGDLLLIYLIEKDKLILILADLGSHSDLF